MRHFPIAICLFAALLIGNLVLPRPSIFADDGKDKKDEKKKEAPKLSQEEIDAKLKADKEAKKPGTLLKRAQGKIDAYTHDNNLTLCKTVVFYGRDEDNQVDVKAFAEYADGTLGLYYANVDPDNDAWMPFEKSNMEDLEDIGHRQDRRGN